MSLKNNLDTEEYDTGVEIQTACFPLRTKGVEFKLNVIKKHQDHQNLLSQNNLLNQEKNKQTKKQLMWHGHKITPSDYFKKQTKKKEQSNRNWTLLKE